MRIAFCGRFDLGGSGLILCSLILVVMGTYLYIHGKEFDDQDAVFNGAAVLIAGIAGMLLGLLWPLAVFGSLI